MFKLELLNLDLRHQIMLISCPSDIKCGVIIIYKLLCSGGLGHAFTMVVCVVVCGVTEREPF